MSTANVQIAINRKVISVESCDTFGLEYQLALVFVVKMDE